MNQPVNTIPGSWKSRAEALRREVNFGWFWTVFSPWMVGSCAVGGLLIWLLRIQQVMTNPAWACICGLLLVAIIGAADSACKKHIGLEEAFSRLDVGWKLNHRLVSAYRGVGEWPQLPGEKLPVRLKPAYFMGPLLLALSFLGTAMVLPLPPENVEPTFARVEPPDWLALDTLADQLEEEELVEEEALRALKREVDQLRSKPEEEWYDTSTLEATERLRSRMRMDADRLMQSMDNTAALLQLAEEGRSQLTMQQQQAMQQFLQQMRQQMAEGGLQMNQELMQQLQQLDLSKLQQMDMQQLQQLEQQLRGNCQKMGQCMLTAGLMQGNGLMLGQGGISRGGGPSSPLTLRDFESTVQPVVPMALNPAGLENAQIGDLLEVRETEHEDERESVSGSAGSLQSRGGSGEVVWDQDVLPSEQKVLNDFFQ